MTETRKLRVFLCHSSQDKPVVRELYQRLNAEDWINPWLDEEKLLPGQDWDMEIEKAVEAADVVIVCLSNNSVTKEGYVQRELKFVIDIALEKPEETIFVVPLRLDNCALPRRIRSWHYVDYFPVVQRKRAYLRILQSLTARYDQLLQEETSESIEQIEILENIRNPVDASLQNVGPVLAPKNNSSKILMSILNWIKNQQGRFLFLPLAIYFYFLARIFNGDYEMLKVFIELSGLTVIIVFAVTRKVPSATDF